ncbi:MAG: Protein of unknown function (DUF3426) [Candidatus Kentron sp. G]|nr:MAG: Protein of unknown function (DUF3426) [Candidatus Kentron sp. G]VFN01589.1 MAG: Protein of unknown function (DUF3426) [Candidatus Kentron sp. G]VFN05342.1 MAG: Protein of unknown function (DUF3426) [Candidatus Kentron sp. G]
MVDAPSSTHEARHEEEQVPWILREDIARSRPARTGGGQVVFGLGVFVLSIVLLGQYVWFHSLDVLQRFPASRPWMERFCEGTGCNIPVLRDPARIRMMDREVRVHPKYEGALLISARMVNHLSHAQPFPRMRFTLFNVNGGVVAARTFEPREYLDNDIDITAGMGSHRPIQVILSVLAQEEAAVSFEFMFL